MFSWPNNWEHASFGRNQTSVELAQKNLVQVEKDEGLSGEGQSPRVEKDEGPSGER